MDRYLTYRDSPVCFLIYSVGRLMERQRRRVKVLTAAGLVVVRQAGCAAAQTWSVLTARERRRCVWRRFRHGAAETKSLRALVQAEVNARRREPTC